LAFIRDGWLYVVGDGTVRMSTTESRELEELPASWGIVVNDSKLFFCDEEGFDDTPHLGTNARVCDR
jgi:hypothetical protein